MNPEIPGLRIEAEAGRGSYGIVYRAHDDRFDRKVAVKVIHQAGLGGDTAERFARECRALGALSGHPNIVAVYDAGITGDGDLYIAMEYLDHGSLGGRVRSGGPAEMQDVLVWGVALCGALGTAHASGIIHRDVKPENILFSALDNPKLVDFGIARMRSAFETQTSSVTATLHYAAPEVVAAGVASPSADMYALTCSLYFALAGRPPFEGTGTEEGIAPLIARIATQEASELPLDFIPAPLRNVIIRGLAKRPEDRYENAEEMADALRNAAAEEGTIVPAALISPTPTFEVLAHRSHLRRYRIPIAVAVTALLGTGVGLAVTSSDSSGHGPTTRNSGHESAGLLASPSHSKSNTKSTSTAPPASGSTTPSSNPGVTGSGANQVSSQTSSTAGKGSTTTNPKAPGPTVPPSTTPTPKTDTISLTVPANRTNNEMDPVNIAISGSDNLGNAVSYSVGSLPEGLSEAGGVISGTISDTAVNLTHSYSSIQSQTFTVTVTANDGKGATASGSFSWTVMDTYLPMPNYFGKEGDGDGDPNTWPELYGQLESSKPQFGSACSGPDPDTIWYQSVPPGAAYKWGSSVAAFWYGKNPSDPSACQNVGEGWPGYPN